MTISLERLVAGGLDPVAAQRILSDLLIACGRFNISAPARQAAFVAQCAVESVDFSRLEENLNYTTATRIIQVFSSKVSSFEQARALCRNPVALANLVYAGVNGNDPDPRAGDGFRYRGRGWIQLTGKANYALAATDCGLPFLTDPDSAARSPGAWQSSASFWERNGCSALADAHRWDDITRRINGKAMLQKELRTQRTYEFWQAFG